MISELILAAVRLVLGGQTLALTLSARLLGDSARGYGLAAIDELTSDRFLLGIGNRLVGII
jgi:hypothetical protein